MSPNHRFDSSRLIGFLLTAAIAFMGCADNSGGALSPGGEAALGTSGSGGTAPAGITPGGGGGAPSGGPPAAAGNTAVPAAVIPAPDCGFPTGAYLPAAPAAADVYLRAEPCDIPINTFNNPTRIRMWGFIQTDNTFTAAASARVQVPGPALAANAGSSLMVHLKNNLSGAYVEPVSMMIRGQTSVNTPVWIDPATRAVTSTGARNPGDYTSRVRSFAAEAAPGAIATFTYTNLRPGTYLYQSGTHPSVQVQMGLSGLLIVNPATAGLAYNDPASAYTSQAALMFGEIDSAFHAAIAAGSYGPNPLAPDPPPAGWYTSTVDYKPDYFLINGVGYTATRPLLAAAATNQAMLLRFLNAGLASKVPEVSGPSLDSGGSSTIANTYLSMIAQDGNFIQVTNDSGSTYAAPHAQTGMLLAAGQTLDALIVPRGRGDLAVMDRRLNLTNGGVSPGGQLAFISVGGATGSGALRASPSPAAFGTVIVGQVRTLVVTVSNQGVADRMVQSATVIGSGPVNHAADYTATVTTALTVPAGGSATFPVAFHPSVAGAAPATLQLTTNEAASPTMSIPLTGTGQ
jgi:FtsP/CotA-like multicopper oxidase with cupredoxin domain